MKKTHGVSISNPIKAETQVNLEGKHAALMVDHKVGDKASITLHGVKTSHYQHSDGSHSVGFKASKVEIAEGKKEKKSQKDPAVMDEV